MRRPVQQHQKRLRLASVLLSLLLPFFTPRLCFSTAPDGTNDRRIVAVGDVHGTLDGLIRILGVAGIVDGEGDWIAEDTMLVMVGDLIDRGPDDRAVLELLSNLEKKAERRRGSIEVVLGNHEVMNLLGDLRYVSKEAFASFADKDSEKRRSAALKEYASFLKKRARRLGNEDGQMTPEGEQKWQELHPLGYLEHREAFAPEGRYGKWLRKRSAIFRVADVLFVHGGLHPTIAINSDQINRVIRSEIRAFDQIKVYLEKRQLILPFFNLEEMTEAVTLEVELLRSGEEGGSQLRGSERDHLEVLERFLGYVHWLSFHPDGPLWFRGFSSWNEEEGLAHVARLRSVQEANYFVVGHTPQLPREIKLRFDGHVFLIDTGMLASYYNGGGPSALEIEAGRFTAIYPEGQVLLLDTQVSALAGK